MSDRLPFRIGLMQMKYQFEGELPLFRLMLLHPSESRIFPSIVEKVNQETERVKQETEAKVKELEKELAKYRKF